jgi:RNA polymerase sigma-70 factor (ECF subfamily)
MSEEEPRGRPVSPIQGLLARIQTGDDDAARELLARYESKVRLVVRRQLPRILRSRFDSLDFLQSVWGSFFLKIRTGPNDLCEEANLIAFLAWAARNKVIDEYRRSATQRQDIRRERSLEDVREKEKEPLAIDASPSQAALAREEYRRLRDMLPDDRQSVFELKASGHSSREIAEILGISERTVQRVLEDLRRRAGIGD